MMKPAPCHAGTRGRPDPDGAKSMSISREALPIAVVGNVGDTVTLSSILTEAFGSNLGGYADFYVSYIGQEGLHWYDPDPFSYWTATPDTFGVEDRRGNDLAGTMTSWLRIGADIGATPSTDYPESQLVVIQSDDQ